MKSECVTITKSGRAAWSVPRASLTSAERLEMSTDISRAELRAAVEDLIYTGCAYLDEQRFDAWLETTAPEFRYRITAYSPDIRREMIWLDHDRQALAAMIDLLPK